MADDPIYSKKIGDKLTQEELLRAAGGAGEKASGEKVIAEQKATDAENPGEDITQDDMDAKRNFKYPLDLSASFPARIIFTVKKIEGVDILEKTGVTKFVQDNFGVDLKFPAPESKGDEVTDPDVAKQIKEDSNTKPKELVSYENNTGGETIGSITLPLQNPLRYADVVNYGSAKLGLVAGAESALLGQNPFEGATDNAGALTSAGTAMAAKLIARNAAGIAAAGAGLVSGGLAGGILGAAAAGGIGEGLEGSVSSATRITGAPNERTLFESVQIRPFNFDFTMIANSREEAQAVKNIIQMFRQELYPEKIAIGASGVPLAYKFPNVFEIEVKNRFGENPGFKFQRCYLKDVQTTFNNTANGMYEDGSFIEAQLSLQFIEIVALDKSKVRKGY